MCWAFPSPGQSAMGSSEVGGAWGRPFVPPPPPPCSYLAPAETTAFGLVLWGFVCWVWGHLFVFWLVCFIICDNGA